MKLKFSKYKLQIIIPIIIAFFISLIINIFGFRVIIPTNSMYPTIKEGESFIARRVRNSDEIKRGDILAFYSNELSKLLVKRVIGLPGDKVFIDGQDVYVNDTLLIEDYINKEYSNESFYFEVPTGEYLFLGDNRNNSIDSRYWKEPYIKFEDIKGKLIYRFFPLQSIQ